MSEYLDLVDHRQLSILVTALLVQILFDIWTDLVFSPIFLDKLIESVTFLHPTDKPSVYAQRDNRVPCYK